MYYNEEILLYNTITSTFLSNKNFFEKNKKKIWCDDVHYMCVLVSYHLNNKLIVIIYIILVMQYVYIHIFI